MYFVPVSVPPVPYCLEGSDRVRPSPAHKRPSMPKEYTKSMYFLKLHGTPIQLTGDCTSTAAAHWWLPISASTSQSSFMVVSRVS